MTPDIDKIQTVLQWAGGVAVVVGGALAAIIKIFRNSGDETERDRDTRERGERSKRYQLERELEVERLERRFEKIIEALRVSILGELKEQQESWRKDFEGINNRLATVERREMDSSHPRRPR